MPMPIQSALPTWDTTGRFLFPQDRFTFYLSRAGDPILMPPKVPIQLYLDPAGAHVATDLRDPVTGDALPDNTVLVGDDGLVSQFYGAVGVKLYYGRPFGATATYPVEAAYGPILDALYDSGYSTDVVHLPDLPRNDGTVMVWDATSGKPRLMAVLPIGNIPSLSSLYDVTGAATAAASAAQAAAIAAAATDATNKANGAKAASIPVDQKGASNGVATLDAGGLLPSAQLPPLAITDTFVVSSQTAMLALAAHVGDVAVRTDQSKTYILQTAGATVLSHWVELASSGLGQVISVDGLTGIVSLTAVYAAKTHAAQHGAAGSDPVTPAAIGAETPTGAQTKATAAQAAAATDATSKVTAHAAATDPHGDRAFATTAVSNHVAATDPHGDRSAASTALAAHVAATDPHGDRAFTTAAVAAHVAASDPHADRAFATAAIATHAAAADPHGDRAAATTALAAHVAASDPHGDRADAASKYLPLTARGATNGVAALSGGTVPLAQLYGAPVLVLNVGDAVPGGTPAGTVIARH
jgi:hypothetical protein